MSYEVYSSVMPTRSNLPPLVTDVTIPANLSPQEVQIIKNKIRFWLRSYEKWIEGIGPKPDAHPVKNHKWNTHPELFDDLIEETEFE